MYKLSCHVDFHELLDLFLDILEQIFTNTFYYVYRIYN